MSTKTALVQLNLINTSETPGHGVLHIDTHPDSH